MFSIIAMVIALSVPLFIQVPILQHIGRYVQLPAAIWFTDSVFLMDLQRAYKAHHQPTPVPETEKVRVLIVPGHEPDEGGTMFNGLFERDLNAALSERLARYLRNDPGIDVYVTRTASAWDPSFAKYFTSHSDEIESYLSAHRDMMEELIENGKVYENSDIEHNSAPQKLAHHLYGINKWANDIGSIC